MIPTVLLLGFIGGLLHRGRAFVVLAALGWPLLLLSPPIDTGWDFFLGASALAAVNAAVGALLGSGLRAFVLRARLL